MAVKKKSSVNGRLDTEVKKKILNVTKQWQDLENLLADVKGVKPKKIHPIKVQRHMFKKKYWGLKIKVIKK